MIYQLAAAESPLQTFVVRPNQSMSWQGLLFAFSGMATVIIGIGVTCFAIGLPLVLPFSGAELIVLGAAFYLTARRGDVREVITISANGVAVETGRRGPETRAEFQRHWARVVLERPRHSWYPGRLLIRSHGREIEVGRFLNEQERRGLALELRAALRREEGPA
ncbi:MAG: DUF2244 domain-containing protein [Gammaproteobacteria bacterium]|nr:DUF2244 domain-containing protein [Gammaproteobacteria bacterium]